MKFSAAILLQIMLVFFTLPLMQGSFTAKQQTCKEDKCADVCPLKSKQKNNSDKTCSGSCNCFLSCPLCQYLAVNKLTIDDIVFSLNNRINILRNENAVFAFHKECWHPPEAA
jgi:hypothetical protein